MQSTRVAVALLFGLVLTASTGRAGPLTQIVAFGDSLTDTGNYFLASGGTYPPPPYFNGRFSNGPVWVERLASRLGLPGPTPSLAGGTNYAFGGAETGSGFNGGFVPNVETQVAAYLSGSPTISAGVLFVIWGSSANDFFDGQADPAVPVANLANAITTLAQAGGQHFLVPNLPLLGLTPGIRSFGPDAQLYFNGLSGQFDSLLAQEEGTLVATLGIDIRSLDTESLVNAIVSNPGAYGLSNVTDSAFDANSGALVPNPDQYFFWDDVHPTEVVHELIGDAAYAAVTPEPGSLTLAALGVLGVVGCAWLRRRASGTI